MTTSSNFAIVGVAGLPRSGKDEVAKLYISNGWFGVSLGDIVRNAAKVRHAHAADPISVKNMTETSNFLRSTKGADFALKEALALYKQASKKKHYKGLVIYSVRAPVEAEFILQHNGSLVWVHTDDVVRHKRAQKHMRKGERYVSIEDMLAQEALQALPQPGIPKQVQMNTSFVKEKATIVVENNGDDLSEFQSRCKKLLGIV